MTESKVRYYYGMISSVHYDPRNMLIGVVYVCMLQYF